MSAPVNVLAMLDLARTVAVRDGLKGDALDYEAAQAALIELTERATAAEQFIAGFEGDDAQEGIDDLLAGLRAAISQVGGAA